MSDILTCADRQAWLDARFDGIGGSDASAIFGHGFRSNMELFQEKVFRESDTVETEATRMGMRLEPVVRAMLREEHGMVIEEDPPFSMRVHHTKPWQRASLDGVIVATDGTRRLLEIKCVGGHKKDEYANEPPLGYQIQIQHALEVTGFPSAVLAVLLGGQELRLFDIARNDKFIAHMNAKEADFWTCVQTREPPGDADPDGLAQWLSRPVETKAEVVDLEPDVVDIRARLKEIATQKKVLDNEETVLQNQVKRQLGEYEEGSIGDLRVTFKVQNRAGYVVEPKSFRSLRWHDPKEG